jgi:peptidoglycan/xylan/chitin deacetylase (PgdA/CDA1 family)
MPIVRTLPRHGTVSTASYSLIFERRARRILPSPWGNEDTQTLIDILGKYHVKATFFVVSDWVEKYPESVKALHDAGHEIMSHSAHHDHYNSLSSEQITADLKESCDKIEAATGVRPTLIRCPYGEYDDHVIRAVRDYGMEPIQWDVETLHLIGVNPRTPCYRSYHAVTKGSIKFREPLI